MAVATRIRKAIAHRVAQRGPDDRANRWIVKRTAAASGCDVRFADEYIEVVRGEESIRLARREIVHVPHVARDFDVFFHAVDPQEVGGRLVVDYSARRRHHYRPLGLDLTIPSMQETIDVEEVYCPYSRPSAGNVVFDLGANIGVVSIWLARQVGPAGRVVAFEPDPQNRECLQENVDASGLANVTVVDAAISATTGFASFFSEGSIGSGFRTTRMESMVPTTLGSQIDVPTLSLEDAFGRFGTPQWMKIDIEGAELEVIESSLDLLRNTRPCISIETDHVRGGDTTATRIERLLRSIEYDVETSRVGGTQMTWTKVS